MANPTSNFNWQMPTASDLVTDLPADFEVFGQAVDTSLADLKGGTTGQVLSKTSGTDMDFTWVTTDDANAIQNAIVDAKGDLIAASAADTPARLAVGANGETLVADSSTSTGLRYQASTAAGLNFAINGGFDIWQRGTSTTSTSAAYTCADRFATWISSGTGTIERVTANIPETFSYGIKYTSSGASGRGRLYYTLETLDTQKLAGQTVTLSFYVSGTVGKTFIVALLQSATVDNSFTGSYTSIGSQTVTLTATSTRYQATYTIPTTAKTIQIQLANVSTDLFANTENYTLTGVQLEVGSIATGFSRAGGTIQGELAACQRYYVRTSGSTYTRHGIALASSTTAATVIASIPVTMRTDPSIAYSNTAYWNGTTFSANTGSASAIQGTNRLVYFDLSVASGLTAGSSYQILNNNNAAGFLEFSAEL
jgi:hypothetical protein